MHKKSPKLCSHNSKAIPRLRSHPEVTSDQTKSNAHGVFPDQNYRVWDLVPAHNSMIRGHFGLGMVWSEVTSVWGWYDQRSLRSGDGMIRGHFGLGMVWSEVTLVWGWYDQRQFRAHLERTRCFERTLVWSEDTLVWEGLIRGNFRLARSDQGSLPDGTSTWVMLSSLRSRQHQPTFQSIFQRTRRGNLRLNTHFSVWPIPILRSVRSGPYLIFGLRTKKHFRSFNFRGEVTSRDLALISVHAHYMDWSKDRTPAQKRGIVIRMLSVNWGGIFPLTDFVYMNGSTYCEIN